jgi:UDP-N-acetylglucosamine--N-acetylmuramyl-(pentapeptide) pyrophosphoryl-undecaprenol N-acetylglucosamine transferase
LSDIVITGGGTGGHLSIARAVKEELNKRGIKPIFIGSANGQDRSWFGDDEGFSKKYFYDIRSVVDKGPLGKLKSMGKILKAAADANTILKAHDSKTIFSVGGYAAAPATMAAIWQRKRFYIHEQNAVMGRLNALFAKRADAIFSPYIEDSPVKDYPVSDIFFQNARLRTKIEKVIFLGGSQGARAINDFAKSIAPALHAKGIKIIHQSGEKEFEKMQHFYNSEGIPVDLFSFHKKLHEKIAEADFAICRAGASTLWELAASQLPALYVPYPYASGDHQYYNAKYLADRDLSWVVRQHELSPDLLNKILKSDIAKMSEGLRGIVAPDAAAKIVTYMGY